MLALAAAGLSAQAAVLPGWKAPRFSAPRTLLIRVRIVEGAPSVTVRGMDLKLTGSDGRPQVAPVSPVAGSAAEWKLTCDKGQVRGDFGGVSGSLSVESPAGFLKLDGRPFRDVLRIRPVRAGCEVVNVVDVEKYLDGLVNSEFSAKWSAAAIEAQVVAARTYAYHQMLTAAKDTRRTYDVDSTVADQVYEGASKEETRASQAVARTRGQILTVPPRLVPLKAFYHSTCGGRTELPERVWGATYPGFRRQVSCEHCRSSPRYNWSLALGASEIEEALRAGLVRESAVQGPFAGWAGAIEGARLVDVQVKGGANAGARVIHLLTTWKSGRGKLPRRFSLKLPAPRFRDWIGPGRLRSTAFTMTAANAADGSRRSGPAWIFSGRGFGHGVGMCQWGAKVMGEKGETRVSILRYYYPEARIRRVW